MGLNYIYIKPAILHAHFKKRIRSSDPMVPILWILEHFELKAENLQLQIDENHIVVYNHLHTWPQKMDIQGPKLDKKKYVACKYSPIPSFKKKN